jgi:hypothetical protein
MKSELLLISIISLLLANGCFLIGSNKSKIEEIEEGKNSPFLLTSETVYIDDDGSSYIIVSFPKECIDYEFVEENGFTSAVAKLPKRKEN